MTEMRSELILLENNYSFDVQIPKIVGIKQI
jgi:hypothetical protein